MATEGSEISIEMDEVNKFAEEYEKWILTTDGKNSINEALKVANEIADKMREANRINQDLLKRHITV